MGLSLSKPSISDALNGMAISRLLRRRVVERIAYWVNRGLYLLLGLVVLWFALQLFDPSLSSDRALAPVRDSLQQIGELQISGPKLIPELKDVALINERNIFGPFTERNRTQTNTAVAPKPVAQVPLELIGTFVTDGEAPYAIIEERNKKTQEVFVIGESIFDAAKLVKIFPDRVEIDRAGEVEILMLDLGSKPSSETAGGVSAGGGDTFEIAAAEVENALANLPLLMTQARAVPYFKDGQSVGLRLFAIRAGSLYEKIGLRNGDILKSINGSSMADLSQALGIFQQLKDERSISVVLERNREERQFNYQIK